MNANGVPAIRAIGVAHLPQFPNAQSGANGPRPGEQVAHYKGAVLRTVFAASRTAGSGKPLPARMKPRPMVAITAEERTLRADAEAVEESAGERERGGEDVRNGNAEEVHGYRVNRREGGQDQQNSPGRDGEDSRDDNDDDASPVSAKPGRASFRPFLRRVSSISRSGPAFRSEWASAALASGGEPALRRAVATRLFQAALGSGKEGWRGPWLGNVGAFHRVIASTEYVGPRCLGGVRELLVTISAGAELRGLPPNPMRATFFCLLPLVLLDLQRSRTPSQHQELLVRIAAIARMEHPSLVALHERKPFR